jgi:hypothetical protein
MKRFFRAIMILFVLVIVIAIAGFAIFLAKPGAVTKKGVVKVLSYVLKTDVKLESADVSVSKGKTELKNLVISSPEGFETKEAFSAGKVDVDVNAKVFNPMKPEIQAIMIENPQINLEINSKGSNLGKLAENAGRLDKWKFKRFGNYMKIGKIVIDGAKVSMYTTKFRNKPIYLNLPRIEMDNLGGKNGITVAAIMRSFFERILKESLKAGKEQVLGIGDGEDAALKGLRDAFRQLPELKDKAGVSIKGGVKNLKEGVKDKLGQ